MFTRRFTLFRLFGFEVRLDLSWFLLAFLVAWSLALGLFPQITPDLPRSTYWWMGIAGAIGLLFSILFHELSHSLVARRYGLPISGITLFIFGGVAEMQQEPPTPKSEFLMAVAGPIASFVLAFLLYQAYLATAGDAPSAVNGVLYYLGLVNLVLGVFNLVPGFPLDGGRMLRAALWGWKGDFRWATRVAATIGSGFGLALIVLGAIAFVTGNFIGGMWWFLIGLFLRGAAGMSYQQMLLRDAMKGEHVRRFMTLNPVTVRADLPLDQLVEDYIYRTRHKMFPVVEDERVLGIVEFDELKKVPQVEWTRRTVRDIMQPCTADHVIGPAADALEAWSRMQRSGHGRLLVVHDGRLIGILSRRDLMTFLALKFDLEAGMPGTLSRS
ncbi:MAG TPA: site-2 protease family protein [Burkholderiales bacterium]